MRLMGCDMAGVWTNWALFDPCRVILLFEHKAVQIEMEPIKIVAQKKGRTLNKGSQIQLRGWTGIQTPQVLR
jgi:hypothetical protein